MGLFCHFTPLIWHGRRPRIQKIKCLAQKLTQWQMIEKLWQKCKIDRFPKIERFELWKICRTLTKWLSFCSEWSNVDDTGLYSFAITNGEKSRSTNVPNFLEFEELRNFQAMGKIPPSPLWLIGLNTLSWTINFDDTLSVIALNKWNGGIIEPTLICLIHFYKKLVYR